MAKFDIDSIQSFDWHASMTQRSAWRSCSSADAALPMRHPNEASRYKKPRARVTVRLGPAAGGHDAQYDVKLVQEMEAAVLGTASSQAAVYKASAHGIAGQLLKGCSGCWIACGPPQSGKTYSTVGHLGEYARMGVVPRLASDILESLAAKPDLVLRMSCARWSGAVLVQDLLAIGRPAAHACRPLPAVPAKPRGKGGLSQGQGLVKEEVTVLSEVLLMLERATRAIAAGVKAPDPLDQSSVVILLSLWHKPRARGQEGQLHASVACVDMASQESLRKTLEIWAGGDSGERPGQASVVVAIGGGEASRRARPSVRSLLQTCRLFVAGNMGETLRSNSKARESKITQINSNQLGTNHIICIRRTEEAAGNNSNSK